MPQPRQRHGVTTSGTSRLLRAVLLLGVLLGAVPATAAAASAAVTTAHLAGCGAIGRGATTGDRCPVHELDGRGVSAKASAALERRDPPRGGAPAACCPASTARPPQLGGVESARPSAQTAPPAGTPGSVGRRGPPPAAGS